MSSYSRAASAASSKKAKAELIRLLFAGGGETKKTFSKGKILDHSRYSYADLRNAYLKRVQEVHPDKTYSHRKDSKETSSLTTSKACFVELKNAWDQYERFARKVDGRDADFTLFGVGCSFADSDAERLMRDEITEQACRGWFSSGSLAMNDFSDSKKEKKTTTSGNLSLLDESMFEIIDDDHEEKKDGKPSLVSPRWVRRK